MAQNVGIAAPVLGKLITGKVYRDAIHIPVAPVTAGHNLEPGDHVGFLPNGKVGFVSNPIMIIDPFLEASVKENDEVWAMVYPNTISSLRHAWSHPAFKAIVPERQS